MQIVSDMKFHPNENVLRLALITFSILFGILSVSLIALGVVYMDELWWPRRYVALEFIELPTLLIVLGSLSLAMSIAGCLCSKTTNRAILISFAAVLTVILCLQLSIAVIAFINFEKHEGAHTKTHRLMANEYTNHDLLFKELEEHYKCCGVDGNETDCTPEDSSESGDSTNRIVKVEGCAAAVNEHVQVVALEIGYYNAILALLQFFEIGYVLLIYQALIQRFPK